MGITYTGISLDTQEIHLWRGKLGSMSRKEDILYHIILFF